MPLDWEAKEGLHSMAKEDIDPLDELLQATAELEG